MFSAWFLLLLSTVICQSKTYQSTCPETINGCSEANQCESCFSQCGYCQNTQNSTCSASHCMTCNDAADYTLIPISSDGSGYCDYSGYQHEISFFEFENQIKNHDLAYQTSNNDQLSVAPLLSITFLYSDRVFMFGGFLYENASKSVYDGYDAFGFVYVSNSEAISDLPGTPSPVNSGSVPNSNVLCCSCLIGSNYTGCAADSTCEQYLCAYDQYCCNWAWDWVCAADAWVVCNNSLSTATDSTTTQYPTLSPTVFDTSYKASCPSYISGCSTDNICDECYYLCEFCLNTDTDFTGTTCTEYNCLSCVDGYELIKENASVTTGYCQQMDLLTTPSPTADYLLPQIIDWHKFDLYDTLHASTWYFCMSQCYSTPKIGNVQVNKVFILFPFDCNSTAPILFEIHPKDLIHGNLFDNHQQYDLSEYLCDESIFDNIHGNDHHPLKLNEVCLTWHPLDPTLYIIYRDRILLYDVDDANYTEWAEATLSAMNVNVSRGCTVDQWFKYVWITDDDSDLFVYDTWQDVVIDVGSYNKEMHPVEYYQDIDGNYRINTTRYYYSYYDVKYPRMLPLNDDFILISSARSHHIFKSNSTSLWHEAYHPTQTKYADMLCHARLPHDIHAFSAPVYSDFSVVHFGAFVVNESNCVPIDNYAFSNCTKNVYPHHKISYFEWQSYWRLILAPSASNVLFGDGFEIDNQLIGGCDLSVYYDQPYYYGADELDPLGIEIYIESDITYSTYMYLIGALLWQYPDGTEYYGAESCYLCPNALTFSAKTFKDADSVLETCRLCSSGVQTSVTDKSAAGSVYDIHLEILQYYGDLVLDLQTERTQILLKNCQPGYGIAAGSSVFDCNECPFNQFSLRPELKPCIACSDVSGGIDCEGGNRTVITYNWWVAAYDRNTAKLKLFYEISSYDAADYEDILVPADDTIITALCPPKYCCQSVIGCDYLSQYLSSNQSQQTSTLCAEGRDITVPLCGACLPGYAEMLGTTKCGNECDKEYLFLVPVTFAITLFMSIYVVFFDSRPRKVGIANDSAQNLKEINIMRLLKKDMMDGFQTIVFKPVLYYFQSLSPILNTRGITLWLSPLLAFFNFNLDAAGSDGSALCWSSSLDANTEILLNLVFPLLLMMNILIPCLCINTKGGFRCGRNTACRCCGITFVPYFAPSFFRVLLIVIGVVLTVCFKYLTFVKVADKQLMFYSANLEAFGKWWISGFVGIIMILLCFVFLFWRIKIQNVEERFASSNKYRKFIKSYKRRFWFWEFVLFSRRFFVAFFTSIQFVGGDYSNFLFVLILMVYFGLQIQYKPFAYTRVNRIETLCLCLLLAAFVSANFIRVDDDDTFVAAVLSVCILIPLVLLLWYAIQIIRYHRKMKQFEEMQKSNPSLRNTNRMLRKDVSRMLKRTPQSFRDALTGMTTEMKQGEADDDDDDDVQITATTTKHIQLSELAESKSNDYEAATVPLKAPIMSTIGEDLVTRKHRPSAETAALEAMMMADINVNIEMVDMKNNEDDNKDTEDVKNGDDVEEKIQDHINENVIISPMVAIVSPSDESEIIYDNDVLQRNESEEP